MKMKKKSLLAMSLMGLALVACSEDEQLNGGTGNTALNENDGAFVSLTLDITSPETKGSPNRANPVEGTTEESTVSKATIVIDYGETQKVISTGSEGVTLSTTGNESTIKFKAPEGAATFYVYANLPTADAIATDAGGYATSWASNTVSKATSADAYYTDNSFFMSNEDGKGVETTITKEGDNTVTVPIERGAAKVTVESKATIAGTAGGTLHSLSYGLGGMADKFYLLAQSSTSEVTGATYTGATADASYLSVDLGQSAYDDSHEYENANSVPNTTTLSTWEGLYCLENIHSTYKQKNTTYANFKTTYTPGKALDLIENSDKTEGAPAYVVKSDLKNVTAGTSASTFYVVRATEAGYESLNSSYLMESDITGKEISVSSTADETTGYYTITGIKGITKVDKYTNGECWFGPVWINNEANEQASPIYRNDWYHLMVTKITLPGSPTKPEIDPEEPLVSDVDITVKAAVCAWEFEPRQIELK